MVTHTFQIENRLMAGVRGKPRPPVSPEAALIGDVIRERRVSKAVNKRQEDIALEAGLSQKLISQVERGEQDLRASGLNTILGIVKALNWTLLDLQQKSGVNFGLTETFDDAPTPTPATLFPNLALAAEMYGKGRNADLNTPRWLNYLNNFDFADGRETDPEGWLELFQTLRRANVEPGEN